MTTPTSVASKVQRTDKFRMRPERILIADDEHLVASGLRNHLIELGYAVIGPAGDGDEAVELARTERPDLAILDIRMSGRDGLDAGSVISGQFGIPIIVVSAYSNQDYVDTCSTFQTYGYLLKPVTQDDLRVCISVAWRRYIEHVHQSLETDRLRQRLDDRRIIEQAKWLLVERKGITEPDAMRLLQQQARNNRRALIDVAKSLVESEMLLNPRDNGNPDDDDDESGRGRNRAKTS